MTQRLSLHYKILLTAKSAGGRKNDKPSLSHTGDIAMLAKPLVWMQFGRVVMFKPAAKLMSLCAASTPKISDKMAMLPLQQQELCNIDNPKA